MCKYCEEMDKRYKGKHTCHIVMDFDKYPGDYEYMRCNISKMAKHISDTVMLWFCREFANREDVGMEHGRFALVVDSSYKIVKQTEKPND